MDEDALVKLQEVINIANAVKEQSDKMALQIQELTTDVKILKDKLAILTSQSEVCTPPAKANPKAEKGKTAPLASSGGVVLHVLPAYSDKALVVYGKEACMMLKDRLLKVNNFSFNKNLRCGAGWIVPRSKMSVQQLTTLVKADLEGNKITVLVENEAGSQEPAAAGGKRKKPDLDSDD